MWKWFWKKTRDKTQKCINALHQWNSYQLSSSLHKWKSSHDGVLIPPHSLCSLFLLFLVQQRLSDCLDLLPGLTLPRHSPSCQGLKQCWQKSNWHLEHCALLRLSSFAGDWQFGHGRCFWVDFRRIVCGNGAGLVEWVFSMILGAMVARAFLWVDATAITGVALYTFSTFSALSLHCLR